MNDEAEGYADNYTVRPRSQSLQAVGYSYPGRHQALHSSARRGQQLESN